MEGLFRQPRRSMVVGLTDIIMCVKFGATGLPKLQIFNAADQTWGDADSDGGSPATYGPVQNVTISRTALGTYLVTFTPNGGVPCFLGLGAPSWETTTGIPTAPFIGVKASTVPIAAADSFTFVTSAETSSSVTTRIATDPASGEVLKVPITFQQY